MPKASASRSVTRTAVLPQRGDEKKEGRENQDEQREAGRIRDPAHAPALPPSSHRALENRARDRECPEDEEAKIKHELDAVIEHVMPHLVRHHEADLRQRALLEQVVV